MSAVRSKQASVEKIRIVLDSDWGADLADARALVEVLSRQVRRGETHVQPELDEAQETVARLMSEIDQKTQWYRFRSIGEQAYDNLVSEHPPQPGEQTDFDKRAKAAGQDSGPLLWSPRTFPPALVAAAAVDPEISFEDAQWMFSGVPEWNEAETMALFNTALAAQTRRYRA